MTNEYFWNENDLIADFWKTGYYPLLFVPPSIVAVHPGTTFSGSLAQTWGLVFFSKGMWAEVMSVISKLRSLKNSSTSSDPFFQTH